MPNLTNAVNKLITTFLIVGYSFWHTMAKILSNPALLNGAAENTTLATYLIDIGTIGN